MTPEQWIGVVFFSIFWVALFVVIVRMSNRQLAEDTRAAQAAHNRCQRVASGEELVLDAGARPVLDEDLLRGVH